MSHSHLALIGLMGSGKSSVGRLVAAALDLPLVDVDDAIHARTGRDVEELWREGGEAAYRPLERAVVLDALDPANPSVLAAPGGIVVDDVALAALAAPHVGVVYLRARTPRSWPSGCGSIRNRGRCSTVIRRECSPTSTRLATTVTRRSLI